MAGDRSPNYPIISLADAVGRVQAVYEKERQNRADKVVIAKDLGYGSLNGLSRSIISALVKFGLLTEDGDQLKVSMDALDVLLHSAGSPERSAALQRAAFLPPLFSELRATFDGSLPSDENLRAHLVKRGFNPNTVANVIKSYRDTVLFVGQEAQPEPEAAGAKTPGPIMMFPAAPLAAPGLELAFNLAPGCHARLSFTGEVTQEALSKLKAYLDLGMDTFPTARQATGAHALDLTVSEY
ncbi:MAG: hypothetical protein JWM80_6162 [Cyanobacteria bacterium RYN_339]|nr:hypothetical protein [Cyanobacteria bacterium RYN_339]